MSKKLPKNKVAPAIAGNKNVSKSSKSSTSSTSNKNSNEKIAQVHQAQTQVVESIKEKKVEMTEEQLIQHSSAIKIQCFWRKHKAIILLKKLKQEKNDLNEKLTKLEQEAFIQMIKMEQQREEKKRLKMLKEKQLKKKRDARRKKFLEAAYDGNLQEMKFLINDLEKELDELSREADNKEIIDDAKRKQAVLGLINSKDMNNNSALSEASAGGSVETCLFLLKQNADPNSRGAFGRTPIWRAAFAGNLECVQCLLENGADPRLYSQDGQRVRDAATKDNVIELLENWNIQLTDQMLQQIEKTRLEIKKEQINSLESRKKLAHKEYTNINTQYELVKNELYKCNLELQRLHDEYLLNPQMYAPLIEQKEGDKTQLQLKYDDLREKSFKARINYKDLLNEIKKEKRKIKKSKTGVDNEDDNEDEDGNENKDDDEDYEEDNDEKMLQINIKEFDDMILRDLTNIVKNSTDKWPLIVDQNEQAATFLRYRDTNYVNCLDIQAMQPDKLRLAIIGSIRYGKPFVVDLMQYDKELFEAFKSSCSQIDETLFDELCNKSLMEKERFLRLANVVKDGKEYEIQHFNSIRMKNFKVIFLTSNPYPNESLVKLTLPIKIITSSKISADDLDSY
jgi:ankyrin repeat protein